MRIRYDQLSFGSLVKIGLLVNLTAWMAVGLFFGIGAATGLWGPQFAQSGYGPVGSVLLGWFMGLVWGTFASILFVLGAALTRSFAGDVLSLEVETEVRAGGT